MSNNIKNEGDKYDIFKNFFIESFKILSPSKKLLPNWHIDILCETMQEVYAGSITRLIVCMPPRYMKSLCISTSFPAWLFSRNSAEKVIVASYAMPLAEKLSVDTKAIMESDWYKTTFPQVEFTKMVNSKKKFATTLNGFRLATSINGSLTGEGCDVLIADDPQKPLNITSKRYRDKTFDWLLNTFFSRLNDKKQGKIIIVMQRLHADDIVGRLTGNKLEDKLVQEVNGWTVLSLPAIAKYDETYRKKDQPLNPQIEDIHTLLQLKKQMGSYHFNSQYQQSPNTAGNGFLKKSQVQMWRKDVPTETGVFISVDSAFKGGTDNDFTAISVWTECEQDGRSTLILVDVMLQKLEFNELISLLRRLFFEYCVHQMLIEDKGSGISVIQNLKREFGSKITPIKANLPKEVRFLSCISHIECGDVMFHEQISQDVFDQLFAFPHGKHDDAVDSISQFINWYFSKMRTVTSPSVYSF